MELIDRVRVEVKAGRHNDRFTEYNELYEEISGKKFEKYDTKCTSCSCKYLYGYLKLWYDGKK